MRTFLIIGAAGLVLVGAVSDAEARGRRRSVRAAMVTVPAPGVPGPTSAATESVPARPPLLRPILPVLAPAPTGRAGPVRTAGPWCGNRRVVGTGAGFCEIN